MLLIFLLPLDCFFRSVAVKYFKGHKPDSWSNRKYYLCNAVLRVILLGNIQSSGICLYTSPQKKYIPP